MASSADRPSANPSAEERLSTLAAFAATPFATLDDAIEETLALLADLAGLGLTMIHRLDGDNLVITHACDRMGLGVRTPMVVKRTDAFCDAVLDSLAPLVVTDADADPRFDSLPGKLLVGTRAYIGVPILLGDGRPYGTLCAHDRRPLQLGDMEIAAMRILARIIASYVERDAALEEKARALRWLADRNRALDAAVHQLDALRAVVETISSELDLTALLQQVIVSAVGLLDARAGAISLVGDSPDAPRRLVVTHNIDAPDLPRRPVSSQAGLMGEVLRRREPVVLGRYDDLADPLPDPAFHALKPWVAVPIWRHDEIIGTFGVGAQDAERQFGEREIELMSLLAKHAAIGIENARLYAASRELGMVEERNRLALEIHDTLAQSLLTLTLQIRAAARTAASDPRRATEELEAAEALTRAALADVRRSVWNLGPAALEAGNLVEALQGETDRRRAGLPCRLLVSGSARPLTPETQLAALRVAQEAIANSRKHAAASSVEIELTFGDERAILAVADDGRGFDPATALAAPPTPHGGMGLRGMAERVRRAGGEMEIVSAPGQGARIVVQLPYAPIASPPDARLDEPVRRSPTGRIWRAIVIDDHPAARAGLRALLAGEPDIDVVGEAGDGEAGLRLAAELRPDVALVDLRLPKLGGIELIARLDRLESATRTLVVTSFGQDELVLQALRAGARGYLLKDAGGAELAAAVRAVAAGGSFLGPVVAAKLTGGLTRPERLTPREREVLGLLGRGLTDKEIAAELGASAKTANFHVANVLAKLNANNRTDAVRIAYERGLLGS